MWGLQARSLSAVGNSVGPKPYNANHNSSCSSKTTAVFFKKYKKKICFQIRIPFQPHPLRLEDGAGRIPTLVLVACWCSVVLKPRAKSPRSSGEKQGRRQREGWARWLGPRTAASLGWRPPREAASSERERCLTTGSGFICLSFSQRGW